MKIKIDSFFDGETETYFVLGPKVDPANVESGGELVTWEIDSLKANSLTLQATADKAAQMAHRFTDGTYAQSAFNAAYNIAFLTVHCTGYKRNGIDHPAMSWEQAVKLTPQTSAAYPILDDNVLTAYVARATTFFLPVRPKPAQTEKSEADGSSTATE